MMPKRGSCLRYLQQLLVKMMRPIYIVCSFFSENLCNIATKFRWKKPAVGGGTVLEVQETIKLPFAYKKLKKLKRVDKKQISGSKFKCNKLIMPAICMLLVVVMGAVFNQKLLFAARESYDAHAYEAEITRLIEEYKELVYEKEEEREEEERKREEYIERATEAFNKEKVTQQRNTFLSITKKTIYKILLLKIPCSKELLIH